MRPHRNYPHQPVGWGTFTEAPPPVLAPYVEARPADWLLLAILRPAWAYRLELSFIVLLSVAFGVLGGRSSAAGRPPRPGGARPSDRGRPHRCGIARLDAGAAGPLVGPLPCPAAVGAGLSS